MEQVYALEVTIIEFVQYWFEDWDEYMKWVNDASNPHMLLEFYFPLLSIVDSVFAAQMLLVLSFGGWLNTVMKWWLLEDRPYWWVQETTFYSSHRPRLKQTRQTCETGPGSPSGHSAAGAAALVLLLMFISHIMRDRKFYFRCWKYVMYPLCGAAMASIMLARLYVGAHFPHQCLLGALVGAFMAPALCIYVSDPYIWKYGPERSGSIAWHATAAVIAAAIGGVTYAGLKICGIDPQWTVKLAFRWCQQPSEIHVTTTPLFALVQSTAALMGWAVSVTPAVAEYRHYTPHRSLIISSFTTGIIMFSFHQLGAHVDKTNVFRFYASHFVLNTVKPALLLRLTPALAMLPFTPKEKTD
ncbi:glucose-6-phosphatase 3 [Leguminivora glycinivorella]|uniref:glucose-6-phosphatase 3 n=1 Tax=Leguminivora glycinivorella TaxID=1035111 RepID=UPI00200D3C7F|nr:glucose-6-phosphatase 3 [Leguminivora glycinivorella]